MADKKFTKEELAEALLKKAEEVNLLDDDVLENVAGGAGLCCNTCQVISGGCLFVSGNTLTEEEKTNNCGQSCTTNSFFI